MKRTRPVNLNLFTIHFPLPALISLFHRITGFILFLFLPVGLWIFSQSLTISGYETLKEWSAILWVKFIFWLLLAPLCYHFVAGIRHLLMDFHIGTSLTSGRVSSYLALLFSFLFFILIGIWLW